MAPIPDLASPQTPDPGFSITHQKVELDIDFRSQCVYGKTEITINPESRELRNIRLNCRQCKLKRFNVNGKPAFSLQFEEPYGRANLPWGASVHQYHMLQQRVEGQLKDPPEAELVITLPKSFKIEELDPLSEEAQTISLSRTVTSNKRISGDASTIDPVQGARAGLEQTARFKPIMLNIEYEILNVRDGMHFVGCEEEDLRYPHAYSLNSLLPGAACCLFPCLDELNARCTWEIAIKCPKTVGDAFNRSSMTDNSRQANGKNDTSIGANGTHLGSKKDLVHNGFNDEDNAMELTVVCSGDMTDEIIDAQYPWKKTTSFSCTSPVSAQHIGFAIGPFEHVNLAEFRDSDQDDRLGQNAVPVHGFCMPGRTEEVKNTCFPLAKAVDFFTMTYGSYPFSSHKICFLDDVYPDIIHVASLSICNSHLLFPEDIIEPIDRVSRQLVHALASQWSGIDIIPQEPEDTWAIVGIAYFMTDIFMKKLCGNNEYRFNQKKAADQVVELDISRPSLSDAGALITLDASELDFIALKAPLVLFILDHRLVKAGHSSGLARVISKIFLNAKLGDLPNGSLATPYFAKTCEKFGHLDLKTFFAQWVEGAGCPKFRVSQRFNKKKLVVEMMIQQVQGENLKEKDLESDTFIRDVKEEVSQVYAGELQPTFVGPMTIRIHEADGTPYEHIIEIKETLTKFEVPYNTKYKRLKRSRRQKERSAANTAGIDYTGDGTDDVLLYSLGDVLRLEEEIKSWKLQEWSEEEESKMSQESYEWIRMDADFEWICKMSLQMPGHMWVSQLEQDRDVVAQLESIQYMAIQGGHPLISTFCVRTLMDHRYFHGIRKAAADVLATCARDEFDWIGLYHLERTFQEHFCYTDSPMTRPNDFSDRASYKIRCAILQAISKVRDANGAATFRVRNFLLEKLKFNDNSNNDFSDGHYIATLMRALADAMSSKPAPGTQDNDEFEDDGGDDIHFHNACLEEIDRYRRIDEWIPSHHNILSTTALDCKRELTRAGAIKLNVGDFLQYTQDGTSDIIRLNAFSNLMQLGLAKHELTLRWFLMVLGTDASLFVREHLLHIFGKALGRIAIGEQIEAPNAKAVEQGTLIIEQDASTENRKAELARKQTITGAVEALKEELGSNTVLKQELWNAITSPALSLRQMGELLSICDLLYTPETSMNLVFKYPRYWKCKEVGKGKLLFSHTNRVRTKMMPKRPHPKLSLTTSMQQPHVKREKSNTPASAGPRPFLKPPRPPMQQMASNSSIDSVPESPDQLDGARPKLKIKLKFGGGLGRGGGGGGGAKSPT